MIRSVLTLQPAPGRDADLEEFFRHHRIVERANAFPGCRGTTLFRPVAERNGAYLVIADWETTEDYAQWVADPWRTSTSAALSTILSPAPRPGPGNIPSAALFTPASPQEAPSS